MSKMGVDDSIMIIGDFNLPKVEWSSIDGVLYQTSSDASAIDFLDGMNALGLSQFNSIRNNNGRTLDLVFCCCSSLNVVDCEDLADCQSMHHQPLNITYYFVRDGIPDTDDIIVYNYNAGDYPGINEEFSNINWTSILTEANVDDCVLQFNSVLKHCIARFIPQRVSKSSFKEPWFNKRLVNLQNRKSKASKRYSKSRSERDQQIYKDIRKEFKTLNDFLYQNYMTEIEMEISSNPKRFFAYINSRKNSRAMPSVISHNGTHFEGIQNICNTFAEFFKNNYLPCSSSHIRAESVSSSFTAFSLTLDEVQNGLDNLDKSKGPGPDGIPTIFLKKCSTSLTRPLTIIFNKSLQTGIFPSEWKLSHICPIFKAGNRTDVTNYRGVAILSAIPKLFELLVKNRLEFYLKNCFCLQQHGFMKGRSTVTNLMSFCSAIFNGIDEGNELDVIYTDFSKAFDRVDHTILLDKLRKIGDERIPIDWILSYLTNRKQYVKLGGTSSDSFDVNSGVPQGSHLGPFLFCIFVNDVIECFNFAQCLIYADDIKIFAQIQHASDAMELQYELDSFCQWSIQNRLLLNPDKCKFMSITKKRTVNDRNYFIYGRLLNRVNHFKDLGVIFTSNLSFNKHIDYMINKSNSMLAYIKRNSRDFHDPYTLKTLYTSYVRSNLEYASVVWSPYYDTHSNRIERIQKNFLIFAFRNLPSNRQVGDFAREPYVNRLKLINMEPLYKRREIAGSMLVRDLLCNRIDSPDLLQRCNFPTPLRTLRPRFRGLCIPHCRTNFAKSDPMVFCLKCFNLNFNNFDFHIGREHFKLLCKL